jgi:hypothetical protein
MPRSETEVGAGGQVRRGATGLIACAIALGWLPGGILRADDPLVVLNNASRAAYRHAKEAALARSGPVILVEGDTLVLRRGSERTEVRFLPEVFHALKAFAHIPLAVDVMLRPVDDGGGNTPDRPGRLDDRLLDEMRSYRARVVDARLGKLRLSGEQARRQERIIVATLTLIDAVLESRACTREQRVAYARSMAPLLLANIDEAARAEIDALHRLVGSWKQPMPAEEWQRLTVVVLGRQTPRKDNIASQYFARLLGETGEGRRILYAEGLFEEAQALDLLATRLVDGQAAVDFFVDPERMYRDVLGDAARTYLAHLFPE